MRPTGKGSVGETSLVIMGYGGLQKLQAPAVEVGFSDGLDRGDARKSRSTVWSTTHSAASMCKNEPDRTFLSGVVLRK